MSVESKKLIYILNYVSADDSQHYVHVLNLLAEMKNLGWTILVISEKGAGGSTQIAGQDVLYMSKSGRWLRNINLAYTLVRLRAEGYKLVFVRISKPAVLVAGVIGFFVGSKTLYWLSSANQDLDQSGSLLQRARNSLTSFFILRVIDRFVTGPETMIKYFVRTLNVPTKKLLLLYNDIDLSKFRPLPRPQTEKSGVRILFVHSLSPNKEASRYFPAIVETLNRLAGTDCPIDLRMIGQGSERATLESIARSANPYLKIEFLGAVPNRLVREYYNDSDIFIMPSYREGFPRVVLEAMAMNLPIVSTDAGGTRDLLGPLQQEYVVSRDSPSEFAERLSRLVKDPNLRRQLSEENRIGVGKFSTKTVAEMYQRELVRLI